MLRIVLADNGGIIMNAPLKFTCYVNHSREVKDEILMAFFRFGKLATAVYKNAIKIEIYVHLDSSSESFFFSCDKWTTEIFNLWFLSKVHSSKVFIIVEVQQQLKKGLNKHLIITWYQKQLRKKLSYIQLEHNHEEFFVFSFFLAKMKQKKGFYRQTQSPHGTID